MSIQENDDLMKKRESRDERLKRFRQAARAIGEEVERRGLTEEEVLAQLEETREEVYQKHYGNLKKE